MYRGLSIYKSKDANKDIMDKTMNEKNDIALKILNDVLNINPIKITRFTNGYCHSVYYVKDIDNEYVLRITNKENKEYYYGSIKWLSKLASLDIPVPKILKHGQFDEVFYTLISYINGKDLGEVYHTLNDVEKQNIVKELSIIQKKVSLLTKSEKFGYPNSKDNSFSTWIEYLKSLIDRSYIRIKQNNIFNVDVCNNVLEMMNSLREYFVKVEPTPFLDDITTKNVLIHEGKLSGIVDIDEICYGDPLLVIGLTNMALLGMEADTKYIGFWLDEINANEIQRKVVKFYTLLYCLDFMGEQGMQFSNDNVVPYNQKKVDLLKNILANVSCNVFLQL